MPNRTNHPNTLKYHKPECLCPPCKRAKETRPVGNRAAAESAEAEARCPDLSSQTPAVIMSGTRPVLVDDRSLEARILQVIALKAQGLKYKAIGEKLGISESRVGQIVWEANKKGLIDYANPHEYFENRLTPKIVQNVEYFLDQKSEKMTIEAAKGAGIFKAHQAMKIEGAAPQNVIALRIEMPPLEPGQSAPPVVGMVVGKPRRVLEGQIVGDQENGSGSAGAVSGSGEGVGTEAPASVPTVMALPKPKSLS